MQFYPAVLLLASLPSALAADFMLELNSANVHWGYFSKTIDPVLTVPSGSEVSHPWSCRYVVLA